MKKKITRVLFSLGMAMSLFATQIGGALIVEASAQNDINFEFIMDDGNSIDGEDGRRSQERRELRIQILKTMRSL